MERVREEGVTVYFVDYGNRALVRTEDLRQAPPALQLDLSAVPALGIESSIAGIQPNQAR